MKTSGRSGGGSQGVSPWSFKEHTKRSEDVGHKERGVPGGLPNHLKDKLKSTEDVGEKERSMKIKLPFYMYLANLCTKIVERENLSDPIPKAVGLISAGISSCLR